MRLLFGLDRLPRSLPFDDPRLPGVDLGAAPLRLNTAPVPDAVLAGAGDTHASRLAALTAWLQSQCGDYAVPQRQFIASYLDWAAAELATHAQELADRLVGGLYAAEDWLWSALRPLPRAWIMTSAGPQHHNMAFWDGTALIPDGRVHGAFWRAETLPRSPFRRPAIPSPSPVLHGRGAG